MLEQEDLSLLYVPLLPLEVMPCLPPTKIWTLHERGRRAKQPSGHLPPLASPWAAHWMGAGGGRNAEIVHSWAL